MVKKNWSKNLSKNLSTSLKKTKISSILDIILNLAILGVLIAIIVLLVRCQQKNKELFTGFDLQNKYACSGEKEDPNWRNRTMFQESEFLIPSTKSSVPIATNPIHQYNPPV